ncbi:MAG: SurA N-terminal domain-containing protein [Campylobacter sp.]|nr:SurA N-terminal domain-containing protein [Campylobacter sp.]
MINWMQKHKKSLIPTIWISTIAFVGAGFVGWGAYDYNKNRAGAIAKVGDIKISNQELNTKYRELYSYFSSTSEGFTQEKANEMHLDEIAASNLIQEALLLNFAKDLGIKATKEDIAKYIVTAPEFQVDNKFNKQLYSQAIKNLGITTAEFEKNLEKTIVLQKLMEGISYEPTDTALEAFLSSSLIQDRLSIEIVKQSDENITVSNDELMKFWEEHKSNYMTKQTYELDTLFVAPQTTQVDDKTLNKFFEAHRTTYRNEDDTLKSFEEAKDSVLADYLVEFNKDEAVKTYLNVKKGSIATDKKMIVSDENFPVSELENAKIGEFIKPFEYNDGNLIAKITKINEPKVMEFEQAKTMAEDDFIVEKKEELLKQKAEEALKNFNGKDIGFIARDSANSVSELADFEFAMLLNDVFSNNKKEGYTIFGDKAIAYKITEQKFPDTEQISQYKDALKGEASYMMNSALQNDLLKSLQKRYKIERFYKGRDSE